MSQTIYAVIIYDDYRKQNSVKILRAFLDDKEAVSFAYDYAERVAELILLEPEEDYPGENVFIRGSDDDSVIFDKGLDCEDPDNPQRITVVKVSLVASRERSG